MGRSIGSALAFAFLTGACGDTAGGGGGGTAGGGGGGTAGECSSASECEDGFHCKKTCESSGECRGDCEVIPSNRFLCGDQLCFRDSEACVERWGDLEESTFECDFLHGGCTSCDCFDIDNELCQPDDCSEHDGEIFAVCG